MFQITRRPLGSGPGLSPRGSQPGPAGFCHKGAIPPSFTSSTTGPLALPGPRLSTASLCGPHEPRDGHLFIVFYLCGNIFMLLFARSIAVTLCFFQGPDSQQGAQAQPCHQRRQSRPFPRAPPSEPCPWPLYPKCAGVALVRNPKPLPGRCPSPPQGPHHGDLDSLPGRTPGHHPSSLQGPGSRRWSQRPPWARAGSLLPTPHAPTLFQDGGLLSPGWC